jgi:hypothetical protein
MEHRERGVGVAHHPVLAEGMLGHLERPVRVLLSLAPATRLGVDERERAGGRDDRQDLVSLGTLAHVALEVPDRAAEVPAPAPGVGPGAERHRVPERTAIPILDRGRGHPNSAAHIAGQDAMGGVGRRNVHAYPRIRMRGECLVRRLEPWLQPVHPPCAVTDE